MPAREALTPFSSRETALEEPREVEVSGWSGIPDKSPDDRLSTNSKTLTASDQVAQEVLSMLRNMGLVPKYSYFKQGFVPVHIVKRDARLFCESDQQAFHIKRCQKIFEWRDKNDAGGIELVITMERLACNEEGDTYLNGDAPRNQFWRACRIEIRNKIRQATLVIASASELDIPIPIDVGGFVADAQSMNQGKSCY